MKLNLGCGRDPKLGWCNVDSRILPSVDVVLDLDGPWPWTPGEATNIQAFHVLEHLENVTAFMDRAHQTLAKGGLLEVRVPHYKHSNAVKDPTHKRSFTPESLDYYLERASRVGWDDVESYSDRLWRLTGPPILVGREWPFRWHLNRLGFPVRPLNPGEIQFELTPVK